MKSRSAFTLVELLVVIAIIGVLVALLLPAVQAARESARRNSCLNKVKQISLSAQLYADARGAFPPSNDKSSYSYLALILPYHEEPGLRDLIKYDKKWDDTVNTTAWKTPVPAFKCPSRDSEEQLFTMTTSDPVVKVEMSPLAAHYAAVMGAKEGATCPLATPKVTSPCNAGGYGTTGIMYRFSKTRHKEITDGTSKTFLIGEVSWEIYGNRVWIAGSNGTHYSFSGRNLRYSLNSVTFYNPPPDYMGSNYNANNDVSFGSMHPGGCHFGMADGSCQFISEDVSLDVLRNSATRGYGDQATNLN